jgi:hypothetical protein
MNPARSLQPNTVLGEQEMKTGPVALGNTENVSGCANMKTENDALFITENGSEREKHEK